MLPLDTSCEAEYEDGFILSETEEGDVSLYLDGKNTFYDILEERPVPQHGKMVRFSVFWRDSRYDIDWETVPAGARPIRFRDGYSGIGQSGEVVSGWSGCRFGYQYTDETGKNNKHIEELN